MKLVLGYIVAFMLMTGIIAVAALAIFTLVIGALSFITWSWPLIPINWFGAFRMSIATGWLIATFFIMSSEGNECAKVFAKGLEEKFK